MTRKMSKDAAAFSARFGYLDEPRNEPLRRFLQVVVFACHQKLTPKEDDSFEVQTRKLDSYFPCITAGYESSVRENGGEDAVRKSY
jgi:hypothetical protein